MCPLEDLEIAPLTHLERFGRQGIDREGLGAVRTYWSRDGLNRCLGTVWKEELTTRGRAWIKGRERVRLDGEGMGRGMIQDELI